MKRIIDLRRKYKKYEKANPYIFINKKSFLLFLIIVSLANYYVPFQITDSHLNDIEVSKGIMSSGIWEEPLEEIFSNELKIETFLNSNTPIILGETTAITLEEEITQEEPQKNEIILEQESKPEITIESEKIIEPPAETILNETILLEPDQPEITPEVTPDSSPEPVISESPTPETPLETPTENPVI